jgi:hypothetical protein
MFAGANAVAQQGTLPDLLRRALEDRGGHSSSPPQAAGKAAGVALLVDTSAAVYHSLNSRDVRRAVPIRHMYLLAHACQPAKIDILEKRLYVTRWPGAVVGWGGVGGGGAG